ncbi:MAG: fusA [Acidimicrobiales bacterium]|nr:fusA [Acidimicrobiales bacterium]
MQGYPPGRVRNVVLVGHGGSGKTTLAEALLHHTGVVSRVGRVEDGTTVCDTEPEEVKRRLSLSLAIAPIEVDGHKINLIDTPGYLDFAADVHAALRVADLAVFVVSAIDGVEVGTETSWRLAAGLGVPRMIFVNKLDRERASFDRTLQELQERFGAGVAPLELPIGSESSFRGVADLLTDRAFLYADGKVTETDVPDDMEAMEHQIHESLVEGIVVGDDDLMERYLEGDIPTFEELEHVLADGVAAAQVFPVVCGSATLGVGVDRLVQYICEIGPSPAARPPIEVQAGDDISGVTADPNGPPLALVFKTVADPYVGRISLFKVLSGTIRADDHLRNPRTGADERLHSLFLLRGKDHVEVEEVRAGDIAAVAKLSTTLTGDTLAPMGTPVVVPPTELPEPTLTIAVRARTQADEDKLATALHRLQEEDPALRVRHEEETHQTLLDGMGETHLAVTLERLHRKFGVDLDTEVVKVPYRETVTAHAEAEGKHKKQSGGHGQFGVADIRVDPLPRGAGFEFVDAVVGGSVPRQFIPAVEKGIQEAMEQGGVRGYPVVDVRVELYDGKFHAVDSSEMSFKTAGALAFREAMAKADPVVLEPVSHLEVTVPDPLLGDVMGDLNSRRGRVLGSESNGDGSCVVIAEVPTSELLRYAIDLRSLTGGRGAFRVHHDHYDPVPPNLVDRLVGSEA